MPTLTPYNPAHGLICRFVRLYLRQNMECRLRVEAFLINCWMEHCLTAKQDVVFVTDLQDNMRPQFQVTLIYPALHPVWAYLPNNILLWPTSQSNLWQLVSPHYVRTWHFTLVLVLLKTHSILNNTTSTWIANRSFTASYTVDILFIFFLTFFPIHSCGHHWCCLFRKISVNDRAYLLGTTSNVDPFYWVVWPCKCNSPCRWLSNILR